jgi:6-phosphogluconolactonase
MFMLLNREPLIRNLSMASFVLCIAGLLWMMPASAQQSTLPEGATVSALGRTAQVRSDGSFSIPNVPSNIGPFRIRLIHPNGLTAESGCLTPVNRGFTFVPPLVFGPLTSLSSTLTLQASQNTFTAQGQTAQLQVTGNLQGGGTADITNSPCTSYLSSNAFLATVSPTGLVTVLNMPLFPSTLVINVMNDGVVGTFSFQLQPNTDVDNDGMPNDYEVRNGFNPNFAGDAAQDADFDGLTNLQEFQGRTAPRDPDTDRDGISDGANDPDGAGPIIAGPDPEPLQPETVPPTCVLTSPVANATFFEGETIILRALASDNVGVNRIVFTSTGFTFSDATFPYEAPFVVPTGVMQVDVNATARDIAGNPGMCPAVTINVIPDPLTTAEGRVVDENSVPLAGATVTVLGRTGTTDAQGRFSIAGVSTVQGNLIVDATFIRQDNVALTGMSAPTMPVRGGTTDVGDITVRPHSDFVYINNNRAGINSVSAFSVDANGLLTPIAGSPFATGGSGGGSGFFAANRLTTCVVGSFLFVANEQSNNISVFSINPATGALSLVPGSPFATGGIAGSGISLGVTSDNRFLFASSSGSRNIAVFSIGANGTLLSIPGSPFPAGSEPDGIKVSPDGRFLSVAFVSIDAVGMFTIAPNGALTPVPGSPFVAAGSGTVAGVDINCASNLLFGGEANFGSTNVDVFSIGANGALTPVPGSPFNNPGIGSNSNVVILSPADGHLFASNQASNTITVFNVAANGGLSLVPGSPFANPGGSTPQMIATNRAGTLLYVNNDNGTVSVFGIGIDGTLTRVPGSPFVAGSSVTSGIAAFPAKKCSGN